MILYDLINLLTDFLFFSSYSRMKGGIQKGDPPANYICHKCDQPGHWIRDCPITVSFYSFVAFTVQCSIKVQYAFITKLDFNIQGCAGH